MTRPWLKQRIAAVKLRHGPKLLSLLIAAGMTTLACASLAADAGTAGSTRPCRRLFSQRNNNIPAIGLTLLDWLFLAVNLHNYLGSVAPLNDTIVNNEFAD